MNGELPVVDLIVVGSGPTGAQAAAAAVDRGLTVAMVDVGRRPPPLADLVPDAPFDEIRATDPRQHDYLLGTAAPASSRAFARVGSQLTPTRAYMIDGADRWFPLASETFFPMQALAVGGLGAGWGAGAYTFEADELEAVGLPPAAMQPFYDEVADDIGVAGARSDDIAPSVLSLTRPQPPLDLDTNASALFAAYARARQRIVDAGLILGRTPLAVLSLPLAHDPSREPLAYHDTEFYTDRRRSVYRPRFTVERLQRQSGFWYQAGWLARRFEETRDGVRLHGTRLDDGSPVQVSGRRLALAAGAINTARLALQSLAGGTTRIPLLCNRYDYLPAIQWRMLGRAASPRRHSLSQLTGLFRAPGRPVEDTVLASVFSYRSLLLNRLVRELPMPIWMGVQAARLTVTSLTIVGVFHPDRPSSNKWLEFRPADDGTGALRAQYIATLDDDTRARQALSGLRRALGLLGCVPLGALTTAPGASIHYGGTLPLDDDDTAPLRCARDGRLNGTRRVYVVDTSSWRVLPGKGPTLTAMANARRVVAGLTAGVRADA